MHIATVTGPAGIGVTNTWESNRDVLSVKKNEVASGTVSQFTYEVNHLAQRTGVTTTGSAFADVNRGWSWGYDALGQVTKAVHADAPATLDRAYSYDNIGNRTSSTDGSGGGATTVAYTPDKLNQYDTINPGAPVDPVYDLDGNLKEDAGINAMGYGLRLEWDAENRVTAIRKADNTLLVTYVYDHLGRQIRKTTTAAAYQGASDIAYLYDGWNVVAEYTIASGPAVTLAQAYTWGLDLSGSWQGAGGVGGLLFIHRGPGTDGSGERTWTAAFYPTYDGNGNIREYLEYQVDIDPGTPGNQPGTVSVAHFEYDPFGRIAASSGAVADFTYRFSTKPQDFETGLYYYGYRHYDPVTGRWRSRDPIEEWGGDNLYGFVGNVGIQFVDLLGKKKHEPKNPLVQWKIYEDKDEYKKEMLDKGKAGSVGVFSDLFYEMVKKKSETGGVMCCIRFNGYQYWIQGRRPSSKALDEPNWKNHREFAKDMSDGNYYNSSSVTPITEKGIKAHEEFHVQRFLKILKDNPGLLDEQ